MRVSRVSCARHVCERVVDAISTTSRVRCRTLLCESRARARMRVLNMIDKRVYSERKQRTKRERFVDMDFVRPRDVEMLDASS
jgi:hypothetical protein